MKLRLVATLSLFLCSALPSYVAGRLLISEIMIEPTAVPKSNGTYYELYNPSETPYNLTDHRLNLIITPGWRIVDAGLPSGFIAPKGTFVICINQDPQWNGGITCDWQHPPYNPAYGNREMERAYGGVYIQSPRVGSTTYISWNMDKVLPFQAGASITFDMAMNLTGPAQTELYRIGWCVSQTPYGITEPATKRDRGSPGRKGTPGVDEFCPSMAPTKSPTMSPNSQSNVTYSKGRLIITEIMIEPTAVPKSNGTYYELYNPDDIAYDLNSHQLNLVVSPGWLTVNAGLPSVLIAPKGYFVICINKDPQWNGGIMCDWQHPPYNAAYGSRPMDRAYGGVYIQSPRVGATTYISWNMDKVLPFQAGASITYDMSMNLTGPAQTEFYRIGWCVSQTPYGTTEPATKRDRGSPGRKGIPGVDEFCPSMAPTKSPTMSPNSQANVTYSKGRLIITEIMIEPTAVPKSNGTYYELYNPDDIAYDLNSHRLNLIITPGWRIVDAGMPSVLIAPKGYFVICINKDPLWNGGITCDWQHPPYNEAYVGVGRVMERAWGGVYIQSPRAGATTYIRWDIDNVLPFQQGASITFNMTANVTGSYQHVRGTADWCVSRTPYGTTEPATKRDRGSPGRKSIPGVDESCLPISPTKAPTRTPALAATARPVTVSPKAPTKQPSTVAKLPTLRPAATAPRSTSIPSKAPRSAGIPSKAPRSIPTKAPASAANFPGLRRVAKRIRDLFKRRG